MTNTGAQTKSETTIWEFLFPEVKKETAKASQNVREDLSGFIGTYAKGLDDLYQAIDQNPCRTWGISTAPIGLKYPFPTIRTLDEFFEGHDDDLIYSIKMLTHYISYIEASVKKAQTEFYPKIALFGETIEEIKAPNEVLKTECGIPTGDLELITSQSFLVLQKIANFLPEFFSIGQKFIEFLIYLYSPSNPQFTNFFQSTPLASAFSAIAKFLRVLYTLEALIGDNNALAEGWEHIRRMVLVIKADPGTYGAQADDLAATEAAMTQIHRIVFPDSHVNLFLQSVGQLATPDAKHFGLQLERYLDEEIISYIKLESNGEYCDLESNICDITLLTHFATMFTANLKKRIIENIWNTYRDIPIVKLFHYATFSPIQYLENNLMSQVANVMGNDAFNIAKQKMVQVLISHDNALSAVSAKTFSMFSQWQSICYSQLLTGLNLGYFLKSCISRTIDLHFSFSRPIESANAEHLGRLICLLKSVQMTFFLNQAAISHNIPSQVEKVISVLDKELKNVADIMRKKSYKQVRTNASNVVSLAYHCIRMFSSQYSTPCLNVISDIFTSKAFDGLGFTRKTIFGPLRSLDLLGHYNERIDQSCDTSFLFDTRDLFSVFLRSLKATPRRVLFFVQAFNDIGDLFRDTPELYSKVEGFFSNMLREDFIQPTLSALETELRFHAHQHLAVSERNPMKKGYSQFDRFLQIPPFKVLGRFFDMQYEASYYFTRIFYNEIAVAPQVWETYTEMANIAHRLYGINVLDCRIPGAMMQQEIDVLEIIRNIVVFVGCYNYDLNSQVFVQRAEDSHHVSIVGIPHIFSSYRCHGIGIMNTTVDFTYRFLKSKFNVFSKFLFDDTIKSKLVNDISWFEQHKEECEGKWPYARAEKLVNDMKRLGASAQGMSALDHFRMLITEIGNALGFVRMVKSGGARFLNNAIGFVYDEETDLSFKTYAEEVQLPTHTVAATERLDAIVTKLKDLFTNHSSFFQMLIDVFSGPFRDKKNSHLQIFYAILPSLTLSYIEHILVLKDKAQKQNKNSSFSDDGFPMGIAYILKLLNQDALFDSIHWFDSLKKHAEEERAEVTKTSDGKAAWGFFTGDNKQTVKLAMQMIERKIKEYELLETTVHSARILFN